MEEKNDIEFARRMSQLPPYLFGMINKMKMEKRWNGHDVIDLGMGNPVDAAPQPVKASGRWQDELLDITNRAYYQKRKDGNDG